MYYILIFAASHYNILYYNALYYSAFLRAILYCVILYCVTTPSAHPYRKRRVLDSKDTPPGGKLPRRILRTMGTAPLSAYTYPRADPLSSFTSVSGSYPVRTIRRRAGAAPLGSDILPIVYTIWRESPLAADIEFIRRSGHWVSARYKRGARP